MANWIVGGLVAALVVGAVIKLIRDRKRGKGGCGCGCSGCTGNCGKRG